MNICFSKSRIYCQYNCIFTHYYQKYYTMLRISMHQKIFFTYFLKSKNVPKRKKEVNNPRHFDQVYVKNAKFNWTRTAMSPNLLLIPFRVLGPTLLSPGDFGHYFLKEISADHRALTTFYRRFFRSLRNARLTAIKSAFWT